MNTRGNRGKNINDVVTRDHHCSREGGEQSPVSRPLAFDEKQRWVVAQTLAVNKANLEEHNAGPG